MNLRQMIDSQEQDKGLGDTVKRVTAAIGFKPCTPCKKRAEKLNRLVPYKQGSNIPAELMQGFHKR